MKRTNVKWKAVPAVALACLFGMAAWCGAAEKGGKKELKLNKDHKGYRGFAIKLEEYQVQYIKKGDRVDMLVTFDAMMADDKKEKVTATILQNVLVVDVRPAKGDKKASVQLLMNPKEAQYTALSLLQGSITLIVRPEGDIEMKPMEMSSLRKLFR